MADGKVLYEIRADDSKVGSDLNQANKKVEQGASKIGNAAQKIAKSVGVAVAGMAASAGAAAVAFAKQGISIASDLEEVQNVVDVAFGKSAGAIDDWAKTATNAYGISELAAKNWAGTMGSMLKSMGVASEQTVQMSTDLAGLAGDFASFYNLDHDEAWEKIRSGIAGETEPLKQLGINMSVANLEAFALKEGLDKTYQEMSQSEQTMLRYNYLMSVSADAQGDFARTSDSWANQLRVAKLNMENLSSSIGEQLIPSFTNVLQTFNKVVEESDGDMKVFISNLDKVVDAGAEAAKDVMPIITSLMSDILDGIVDMLPEILDAGAEIILSLADGIISGLPQISNAMGQIVANIVERIPELIASILGAVPQIIIGFGEGLLGVENVYSEFADETQRLFNEIEDGTAAFEEQREEISTNADVAKKLTEELAELAETESLSNVEKAKMRALVEALNEIYPDLKLEIDEVTGALNMGVDSIEDYIEAMKNKATAAVYEEEYTRLIEEQIELEKGLEEAELKRAEALEALNKAHEMGLGYAGSQETIDYTAMENIVRDYNDALDQNKKRIEEIERAMGEWVGETEAATESLKASWNDLTEEQQNAFETIGISQSEYTSMTKEQLEEAATAFETHLTTVEEWNAKIEEAEQRHNDAMGTIYDEGLNTQDISLEQATENLKNQVKEYEEYRENLRTVMSRVPEDVYEYLVGLGPEAASLIADMKDASDPELDAFVEAVRTKNEAARDAAIEEIGELPDKVSGVMEDVADTLKNTGAIESEAEDIGEEIVNGMSDGISNRRSGFLSKVTSLAESALKSVKNFLIIKSPSQKFREQVGIPMAQGMEAGFDEGVSSMTKRVSRTLDAQLSDISKTLATSAAQYQSNTYYQPMNAQYTGPMQYIDKYIQNTPQDVTQLGYQLEIARRDAALAIGAKT